MKNEIMKILQIQMHVPEGQDAALAEAERLIGSRMDDPADVVMLPEMFSQPYEASRFRDYAQKEQGPVCEWASGLARRFGCWLIAGSFSEEDEGKLYNTSLVFDRNGRLAAKHRKVHLFDIDIKGGQRFMESETLTPGDHITEFETEFGRMGLCICYDFRFPEMGRLAALGGCRAMFVPASFNRSTGPLHWELMFRAQAMFNQMYTIGTAPALDTSASYHSWGHSIVCDPWGAVVSQAGDDPDVLRCDIDLSKVDEVRAQIPLLRHRRTDLYELNYLGERK